MKMCKTRFEQQITGMLGAFWQKEAEESVKASIKKADREAIVEEDGAIKWKLSGNYLMDDFCEKLEYGGYAFSREATRAKREVQNDEAIEQYKKARANMTAEQKAEEMFEMRAAFGEGATVIDVLTGERIQL